MKYIKGKSREQLVLFPRYLDEIIGKEEDVRLIDAFVDSLNLKQMGFEVNAIENGRPKYHPKDLLKIFIYGYINKIRSSRELERTCRINIEMMWLIRELKPDHNTINRFRKENDKAINEVFKSTVGISKYFGLIGAELLAGDSTKLRAQNSKKNNYNQKKIKRHQEYIERKLKEYQELLDKTEDNEAQKELEGLIETQKERMIKYEDLREKLTQSGDKQISTSDEDSRQLIVRNNITEVAYNVQTTVDSKYNILIDYLVTNENDSKAMGLMVERAVDIIGHHDFKILYDKGYHTGSEFSKVEELHVEALVAIPKIPSSSQAPNPKYNKSEFDYDTQKDIYICPEGEELYPAPTIYVHKDKNKPGYEYKFKKYSTNACKTCPALKECTKSKNKRRYISRTEHEAAIQRNAQRILKEPKTYKRRQSIVEHPYGTIKRSWGYTYVIIKRKKERVSADVGLIMSVYNLRRIINILGFKTLMEFFTKNNKKLSFFLKMPMSCTTKHQEVNIKLIKLAA